MQVESEVAGYAEGLVTVSEGTGAAPCNVGPCGAAPCGGSPNDTAPCDAALSRAVTPCGVAPCGGSSGESAPCSAAPCKSQRTAAEVESEVVVGGGSAVRTDSVAGRMPERVSPTVFVGAGGEGGTASSRSRFFAERVGGTGTEAAEAQRNSANASSRIRTRASREASELGATGREQHAG